jgi:hypothetical protein
LKGDLQFSKFLKNTICANKSALKNDSSLFPPSIFSLSLSPIQNLKEDLKIPSGMYSTIQLLEIMRPEPVLLNVYGAPELIPRNEFRQPM